MKSLPVALLLIFFGASPLLAGQRQIDQDRSSLTIHVGKTGWLPGAGHEHVVMALIAEGLIDDGRPSRIGFRVEAARLQVMPEEHQVEVQQSMQERDSKALTFRRSLSPPSRSNRWAITPGTSPGSCSFTASAD